MGAITAVSSIECFRSNERQGKRTELLRTDLEGGNQVGPFVGSILDLVSGDFQGAIENANNFRKAIGNKVKVVESDPVIIDPKYNKVILRFWTISRDASRRIVPHVFGRFNSENIDGEITSFKDATGSILYRQRGLNQSSDNRRQIQIVIYPKRIYSNPALKNSVFVFTSSDQERGGRDFDFSGLSIVHVIPIIVGISNEAKVTSSVTFSRREFEGVEPVNIQVWSNQLEKTIIDPQNHYPIPPDFQEMDVNIVRDKDGKFRFNKEQYTTVSINFELIPQPGFMKFTPLEMYARILPENSNLTIWRRSPYLAELLFRPKELTSKTTIIFELKTGIGNQIVEHRIELTPKMKVKKTPIPTDGGGVHS